MLLHVCTFFLTQVFAPFHICASLFSASFFSFFPFFIALSLYPIFTRTLVIALNIFLPRASIYATIRLSLSVFIRLNPCATPGFLRLTSIAKTLTPNKLDSRTTRPITFMGNVRTDTQSVIYFSHYSWKIFSHDKTFSSGKVWIALCWVSSFIINACCVSTFLQSSVPPYSPRVVVIMLILSTLGWCPLNVISGKISVFLSTDSQSTGSLTFKSHVPVFALLSPLITVAVIKRNSFL